MFGIPVELENRTIIGVEGALNWGAVERVAALEEGVNVPLSSMPFA